MSFRLSEDECVCLLRRVRWPLRVICFFCGSGDVIRVRLVWHHAYGRWQCRRCGRFFCEATGCQFGRSHLPLTIQFRILEGIAGGECPRAIEEEIGLRSFSARTLGNRLLACPVAREVWKALALQRGLRTARRGGLEFPAGTVAMSAGIAGLASPVQHPEVLGGEGTVRRQPPCDAASVTAGRETGAGKHGPLSRVRTQSMLEHDYLSRIDWESKRKAHHPGFATLTSPGVQKGDPMLRVYDKYGNERTLAWLYDEFGNVEIEAPGQPADPYFEIVELRENDDIQPGEQGGGVRAPAPVTGGVSAPAAIITRVLDENGAPLPGVTCAFWWPDAPPLPGSGWHEHGVSGATGTGGTVDFAMGGGAYYDPRHAQGPHHLWVYGPGRSEIVRGLGMVAGTNHRHLDVTFRQVSPEPPIEPPPVPPAIGEAIRAICQAKLAIDAAEVALEAALAALGGVCPD